jgi:hypothetical protein
MSGPIKKLSPAKPGYPQTTENPRELCVVVSNISKEPAPGPKTSGVKIRGTGAATKGTIARGPMG